ncbi:MAG TPA: carbohydrate-binding protein [Bacillota bacterium]|nr:carbohydrate-binding protein [Bacillota bacterium]
MTDQKYTNFRDSEQRLKEMHESMLDGGICVDPTPITVGQKVSILYDGLLAQSGADQVYLHAGFGGNKQWYDVRDLAMTRTGWGWESILDVEDRSRLNFCFKDSADHWDNNSGRNWSYEIHNGDY